MSWYFTVKKQLEVSYSNIMLLAVLMCYYMIHISFSEEFLLHNSATKIHHFQERDI